MTYIKELYRFLDELSANNNRGWFEANRERYQSLREQWLADIDRMMRAMAMWEPSVEAFTAQQAAYRIYRDTRFSPDKTPYKTYFSAATGPYGRKSDRAGYYIETGIARTYYQGIYGGVWALEPATLRKVRHAIVDNIEEWESIVNHPDMLREFPQWCSSALKTIPKGWDRNHPQAFYLRMTNYGKFQALGRDFFMSPDWPEEAAQKMRVLKPLVDFINYSIEE